MHANLFAVYTAVTLYRYTDAAGIEYLVNDITEVPETLRDQAIRVTGGVPIEKKIKDIKNANKKIIGQNIAIDKKIKEATSNIFTHKNLQPQQIVNHSVIYSGQRWLNDISGGHLHISSVLLGAGLIIILLLLWSAFKRCPGRAIKILLMLIIAASVGSVYLAWLRHIPKSGLVSSSLNSPTTIINQAQKAVDSANQKIRNKQNIIDGLE
ncbi:MAG: hypothetical protein JW841_01855 [Deltaproteobacteria bacterium]|nr:hypothetical protein [Deltaproteobacteria bacterium]